MLPTGSAQVDAERAFRSARRARRRAAVMDWLRRAAPRGRRLPVYDATAPAARAGAPRVAEICIEAILGTLEPSRSALFDSDFRPAEAARDRWQRIWLAEHRGAALPPITVVRTGTGYAVQDGHHRVSVARARGAMMIDAIVEAAP